MTNQWQEKDEQDTDYICHSIDYADKSLLVFS